jgi:hypothetical protein
MCTNSLESCASQTQREQMVIRKISHSRATTLYVPLPAFMAGIDVSGEARARTFGKKLKIPETSGRPMAMLKHLEISLQISETDESRPRTLSGADLQSVTGCSSRGVQVEALKMKRLRHLTR